MKAGVLMHGMWAVVAVGAFVLGKSLQRGAEAEELQGSGKSTRTERAGAGGGSGGAPGAAGSDRAAEGARSAAETVLGGTVLSPEAMTAALATVLAETDPLVRQKMFAELLGSLTPENARAAVDALNAAPRSRWSWGQEYSLLTYAWGRVDGPAAAAYAKELEGRTKEWTMAAVLSGWANENPDGAKKWVLAIEDDEERNNFMRGLVNGLAQKDVEAATSFLLALDPETPRLVEYMDGIARQQMSRGVEFAADWSSTLPEGSLRSGALEAVAREYVRIDPAKAAEWVAKYGAADDARGAIAEISDQWAEKDPQAALEWVTTLPEGENRTRALGETVSEWAQKDLVGAGEYVATLPPGAERDGAVSAYARRVVDEEPESAIEWAQSIEGAELRNETLVETARDWMRRDVAAANTWMEGAELPPAVTEAILAPAEDDGWRNWRR